MYDRRTDISFHFSFLNPCMTDGQTIHFIPHIGIHVWQTDRHFISFLILESMYDRRTDISFHSSYWNPRMTDGQTFHFIPHIGIHVWQTDRHFISFLILESTYDRRTDISFLIFESMYDRRTDNISYLILESTYDRLTDISFHSSYWNPCLTDGQTTFHFIPYIGIHVWQTDRQHFISFLIFESTYDRRTDISFHSSYWNPCMTDGQTTFHFTYLNPRMTDGQTTFHFIPHIGIHVWQTDRQHFISYLILESTYDRRTDNISCHTSYLNPCMTDGQTFYLIPFIGIHVWQTDRQHFI